MQSSRLLAGKVGFYPRRGFAFLDFISVIIPAIIYGAILSFIEPGELLIPSVLLTTSLLAVGQMFKKTPTWKLSIEFLVIVASMGALVYFFKGPLPLDKLFSISLSAIPLLFLSRMIQYKRIPTFKQDVHRQYCNPYPSGEYDFMLKSHFTLLVVAMLIHYFTGWYPVYVIVIICWWMHELFTPLAAGVWQIGRQLIFPEGKYKNAATLAYFSQDRHYHPYVYASPGYPERDEFDCILWSLKHTEPKMTDWLFTPLNSKKLLLHDLRKLIDYCQERKGFYLSKFNYNMADFYSSMLDYLIKQRGEVMGYERFEVEEKTEEVFFKALQRKAIIRRKGDRWISIVIFTGGGKYISALKDGDFPEKIQEHNLNEVYIPIPTDWDDYRGKEVIVYDTRTGAKERIPLW